MRVRWTRPAARDLDAIGDFIAQDNPGAARRWVARLKERVRDAAPNPYSGRKVPELDRDDVREVFLGSYRLVYRIYPAWIDVITVFEGHRLFPVEVLQQNQKK